MWLFGSFVYIILDMEEIYMNDIKMVLFDFDWTLFDHRSYRIIPSSIKAIEELKKKGIKVVINTGRSYYSLMDKDLVSKLDVDALVVSNGGACIADNKELYALYFEDEVKDRLIKFLNDNKMSYGIVTLYTTYGKTFEQGNVDKFFNTFDEPRSKDISLYKNERVLSFSVFEAHKNLEKIKKEFPDLDIDAFFGDCIGIRRCVFSKREGIEALLKYYNISKDEVLSIGDDFNDVDMFRFTKYSMAVGNSRDEIKKEAMFVSEDIKDDGIYKKLKELEII